MSTYAHLSRHARTPVSVMPNAGLPVLGANGAEYPLTPEELAEALSGFVTEFGLSLVGGCCGTTPEHIRQVAEAVRGVERAARHVTYEPRCRRCMPRRRSRRTPRC